VSWTDRLEGSSCLWPGPLGCAASGVRPDLGPEVERMAAVTASFCRFAPSEAAIALPHCS